ncbi:hypothetical protein IV203_004308 [Nitzschia inconspicua]|uniref:Uncharacterized protein n=1 Tax=Nitzschia inconspicua TaxID=303405 RepID=A0A9K3L436_9STRA|nr:hypothetical protein IV203_004308 [Nitzschia inconspicua]
MNKIWNVDADASVLKRSSSGGATVGQRSSSDAFIRRSSSGDDMTETSQSLRQRLSVQKEDLMSSVDNRSSGASKPGLSRIRSVRSIGSGDGRRSLLPSKGGKTHSSSSKENSNLPKEMQERMKQRAALRANGASTRSLRSKLSESSPNSSLTGTETRLSITKTSLQRKSMFNRRSTNHRSMSMSQLKTCTPKKAWKSSSSKSSTSVDGENSSVSSESQKQVMALQEQILQVEKVSGSASHGENGKSMERKGDLLMVKEVLDQPQCDEENEGILDGPPIFSKRSNASELDALGSSAENESLATTMESTTPGRTDRMAPSILGTIPTIGTAVESSISTTSTRKTDLLQSYRSETSSTRSKKLEELRNFRRSQESQLLCMVQNQQEHAHVNKQDETSLDSTDVIAVIVNLRDELSAAQQVIEQQRIIIEALSSMKKEVEKVETAPAGADLKSCPQDMVPLAHYQELQSRFAKLQMDRAWGEFQLRNRITNDSLKFHRRLRHWKDQSIELRCSLQNMENDHTQQMDAQKQKYIEKLQEAEKHYMESLQAIQTAGLEKYQEAQKEHAEELATLQKEKDEYLKRAEKCKEELEDLQNATAIAFNQFCDAKDRIQLLENEIEELKGGRDDD